MHMATEVDSMPADLDRLTERFDAAWFIMMQNLGPELIRKAQLDLTPGQVFMLHFIQCERECNVSKLAGFLEVNPSAITVMLDRLEGRDFVQRVRDKRDRRVVLVQLTPAGKTALRTAEDARKCVLQHCLQQIEQDKINGFVETLERLVTISSELDVKSITALLR